VEAFKENIMAVVVGLGLKHSAYPNFLRKIILAIIKKIILTERDSRKSIYHFNFFVGFRVRSRPCCSSRGSFRRYGPHALPGDPHESGL
jgi:hypothetical protein